MLLRPNDLILFQGDSITDAGRNRGRLEPNQAAGLGGGYAHLAAATLHDERIDLNLRFLNRGVGGDVVQQMLDRWDEDCLALNPDVLSVLLGINDTARPLGRHADADTVENFDRKYRLCLDRARARNPKLRLVLCEPFALEVGEVTRDWRPGLDARRAIVRRLAAEYAARLVPFQSLFDRMTDDAPAAYWLPDGVHPSPAAHRRMAALWVASVCGAGKQENRNAEKQDITR